MREYRRHAVIVALVGAGPFLLACDADAQQQQQPPRASSVPAITFEEYQPRSTLRVAETIVTRSRFPFIDVHNHQRPNQPDEQVARMVRAMDELNMAVLVNLSGGSGEQLASQVANLEARYPNRFVTFANLSYADIDAADWGARAAERLERDVREHGARGLKIFKNLGMDVRDGQGRRIPTDDPRLDAVWAKAGELGIPVLIHTGDPAPFWEPHDEHNERWLELKEFPNRARPADRNAPWEQIMAEHWNVFRKHPGTTFISAHLAWLGHDLARLGQLLDEHPNVYTEFGAVIAELGRQPRTARQFFIDHQDRIMIGKDTWAPEEYHLYFRVLETEDEYFEYFRRRHAFWRMYGLGLPDEVLRKVYYENALRVIPGLDRELFR
jgi:uncharacterized protein